VESACKGRLGVHSLKEFPAATGIVQRLLGLSHCSGHISQRQLVIAQIAGICRGALPNLQFYSDSQSRPCRLEALRQPAQGAKAPGGFAEQPRLLRLVESWRNTRPRLVEKTGDGAQVRSNRAEFLSRVELCPTQDARVINLVIGVLLHPGLAAVR